MIYLVLYVLGYLATAQKVYSVFIEELSLGVEPDVMDMAFATVISLIVSIFFPVVWIGKALHMFVLEPAFKKKDN